MTNHGLNVLRDATPARMILPRILGWSAGTAPSLASFSTRVLLGSWEEACRDLQPGPAAQGQAGMRRKDKPMFIMDTHAGPGRYDLESSEARRGDEAEDGISKVIAAASAQDPARVPGLIKEYLALI
ncbi:hypothetical protein T484DRAFT_1827669 [Baffinella frigidus]|nr:hypothetical protein T484DRAFT_1827669 [Cryptophyta sp. CCMP2293]